MRALWIALPMILAASPAVAAEPVDPGLPSGLSDPALADRLGQTLGTLTRSLMDMPVGEVEAALEGREPTAADRARRVRDHVGGPGAEREVEAKVAAAGRQVQALGQALMASLPAIMGSLEAAERQLERAVANLPDPAYPKR